MERLAQSADFERGTFVLEVAFAEVWLAEGEVDEFSSVAEDSVKSVSRLSWWGRGRKRGMELVVVPERLGDFGCTIVDDLLWWVLRACQSMLRSFRGNRIDADAPRRHPWRSS